MTLTLTENLHRHSVSPLCQHFSIVSFVVLTNLPFECVATTSWQHKWHKETESAMNRGHVGFLAGVSEHLILGKLVTVK